VTLPEAENHVVSANRMILSLHEVNQTPEKSAYLIDIHLTRLIDGKFNTGGCLARRYGTSV
jgi:hypothetical protein